MDLSDGEDGEIRDDSPHRRRERRDSWRRSRSRSPPSRYHHPSHKGGSSGWGGSNRFESSPPSATSTPAGKYQDVKQSHGDKLEQQSDSDKEKEAAEDKPKTLFGIPLVPLEKKEPPKPPPEPQVCRTESTHKRPGRI